MAESDLLNRIAEKFSEDGESFLKAIEKLSYLEKSGVLDKLIEVAEKSEVIFNLPEEFIDEKSVEIAEKNLELILTIAASTDEETIRTVEKLVESFKETERFEPVGGLMGLISALRDPDVQKSLGYVFSILKNFGRKI